jgi:hypothetical protein
MVEKSDRSHLDPDKVRKVELLHQPPGRERVRVTIEYVTSEVRVLTVHKLVLATVLEELYSQRIASILSYPRVEVTPAGRASLSSRSHTCIIQCGSCSLKPTVSRGQKLRPLSANFREFHTSTHFVNKGKRGTEAANAPRPGRSLCVRQL